MFDDPIKTFVRHSFSHCSFFLAAKISNSDGNHNNNSIVKLANLTKPTAPRGLHPTLISMGPKEPLVISNKDEMRKWSRAMRSQGKIIGLVPTMGFLHEGHLSLVREAHKHSDVIAVSIYVNPGQFSPNEDLSTYPSDFHGDIQKLMSVPGGVDVVFHPYNLYGYGNETKNGESKVEIRNAEVSCIEKRGIGHETWIRVEKLERGLCGKSRPIFFRGVATIVTKLFNIMEPDVAVFGKKDYQQWRVIQRMVRILTIPSFFVCWKK